MGCPMYRSKSTRGCDFFKWVDNPFESHITSVISKLLEQKEELEMKNEVLEEELRKKDAEIKVGSSSKTMATIVVLVGCAILVIQCFLRQ